MNRSAALESAHRLAAASGHTYRIYPDRRRRTGWEFTSGYLVADLPFYTVQPTGAAVFRLGTRDRAGKSVHWRWTRERRP